MDVSIIIVNYNTKELLKDCIRSIKEKTLGVEYEIIVVDNDSSDGSIEMLRREFPDVITISSGANLGFGKANNLGMSKASGKYFLLLNSDTILLNNALKKFYEEAENLTNKKYNIGVLGAILLDKDGDSCHSYGSFISPSYEIKEVIAKYLRFLKDKKLTNPTKIKGLQDVDYITGADMFIPASVYKETGGFDPDFFMYCEEVDWQKRMQLSGYRRIIIEGPEIIHLEGGSDKEQKKTWSANRLANLYKSRKLYRQKHYNKAILPFFRGLHLILDLPAILLVAIINRQKEYLQLIKLK